MPLIRAHNDPANITDPQVATISAGESLLDWLVDTYRSADNVANGLPFEVLLNGEKISEWPGGDESGLDIKLSPLDEVVIVARPGDPSTIIYIVVAIVAAAVAIALAPAVPGDAGQGKTSPNNQLQAATNSFRPGEAIPQIYGTVISYPDFVQPTFFEYDDQNRKIQMELFCIGEGPHVVEDVKTESTLLDSIPGSSFEVYQPDDTVPGDYLQIQTGTSEVDGQVLTAPNDETIEQENQIETITANGIANTTITLHADSTLVTDFELAVDDYLTITATSVGSVLLGGTFRVVSITEDGSQRAVIELDTTDGTGGSPSSDTTTKTDASGNVDVWLGWFTIPGDNAEQVWIQWQMPQGIRSDGGGRITVEIQMQIELLDDNGDPTGIVIDRTVSREGSTLDPQFVTTKFTPAEFPAMQRGQYRARVQRLTDQFAAGSSDQIKMEDFQSITPYVNPNFGSVTMLWVRRRATTLAVSQSSSKINAQVTPLLPTYNRITGVYELDNLQATGDFADAVAHMIIVKNGREPSSVDLAELYRINDTIGQINGEGTVYPQLRWFDFTFDDFDVSLGERVRTACNVARVAAYRDGTIWRFTRDEEKPFRTAMFNRRNVADRVVEVSYQPVRRSDADSIALTYVDPDDNVERTLYRRIDYSTGQIVDGEQGNYPSEVNLAGCRNEYQAQNRADLEIRRIAWQRETVSDTVKRDGLLVGLQQRVGWVDPNDMLVFNGDILGINGDVFETSERFRAEEGVSYFVYVTDSDGNPTNAVPCTPVSGDEFAFMASGLTDAYAAETLGQAGSKYFIGTTADHLAADYLVNKKQPQENGDVQLELTQYVPQMYERDSVGPS